MIDLAIEFGNTYTIIAKKGYGIIFKEPTLVAVKEEDGKFKVIAYGEEAAQLQGKTDEKTTIFSPVSSNRIITVEYAELFLNYALEKVGKILKKSAKQGAMFCIPLSLDAENRNIYEQIASSLMLPEYCLAPSIVLASKAQKTEQPQLMIDLGAGKCDLALIKGNQILKGVSVMMGGKMIDTQIMKILEDNFNVQVGTLVARKIKEELSSLYENDSAHLQVVGKHVKTQELKTIDVMSKDIYLAVQDFFDKLASAIQLFVASIQKEQAESIAEKGVCIFGGLAAVPNLKQYLISKQNIKVKVPENYDTLVMDGAEIVMKNPKMLENICDEF